MRKSNLLFELSKPLGLSVLILIVASLFSAFSNPSQEKTVTLQLNVSEVEYVLGALQEKPMKEVSGLVTKIYTQAQRQLSDTTKKK